MVRGLELYKKAFRSERLFYVQVFNLPIDPANRYANKIRSMVK